MVEVVQPPEGGGRKVGSGETRVETEKQGMEVKVTTHNGHNQLPWQQTHPPPAQSQSQSSRNGMMTVQPEVGIPQYHISTNGYVNFTPNQHQATPPGHAHSNYLPPTNTQPPSYHNTPTPPHNPMASMGGVSSSSEYPVFSHNGTPYSYTPLTPSSRNSVSSASQSYPSPAPTHSQLTPSSPASSTSTGMTSSSASSDVLLPNILHFAFDELSAATSGFTEGLVGMGSFGSVYKTMVRGTGPYAVKKLHNVRKCVLTHIHNHTLSVSVCVTAIRIRGRHVLRSVSSRYIPPRTTDAH